MPNTLAHVGIQGFATRSLVRSAEVKWIFLGCVIPDIPWIFQRLIRVSAPGMDLYDLRLYAVVQSSFFFCLILSAALAFFSVKPCRIFCILLINSFFHLLLDACQTKWANGVHFFAPFSWELMNFDFFWPESLPTLVLSVFGLGYFVWAWKKERNQTTHLGGVTGTGFLLVFGLAAAYLFLPFAFKEEVEIFDNHFVKTLRESPFRSGQSVEFDRAAFVLEERGGILKIFTGEELMPAGNVPIHSGTVSIRGWFIDSNHVYIKDFHEHPGFLRDMASYLGLSLVAAFWLAAPLAGFYKKKNSSDTSQIKGNI